MKRIFITTCGVAAMLCVRAQNTTPALPASITFEHKAVQQGNDEDGKTTTTYWFTTNGDYAMAQHKATDDDGTVLYTKDGHMCMVDEKAKTITIMTMPKILGDVGEAVNKEVKQNNKPVNKDEDLGMTVTKTGKTKTICGFTAYEYQVKAEGGTSSWWYAKVDFDPILIYTMGAGKLGDLSAAKNKAALKNNPMAIPVQNPNYFFAEVEAGGQKGMETTSITTTTYTFSTAGYKIKTIGGLKQALQNKLRN